MTARCPGPGAGAGLLGPDGYRTGPRWAARADALALGRHLVRRSDGRALVADPHRTVLWVREAVRTPQLLAAAGAILGGEAAVDSTFLVTQAPRGRAEIPRRRAGSGGPAEPDPRSSVTVWLAVTGIDTADGALAVLAPASLTGPLPPATTTGTAAAAATAADCRGPRALLPPPVPGPVPVPAGGAVFMDVRLPHRLGPHLTAGHRIGLNIRYAARGRG